VKHKEYIRHTSGNTAVLFIHGFLGSPNHFRPFLELVPENFGIYNVLLHGHGRTVKDFSNASMKIWKEQVENIVLQLSEKYDKIIKYSTLIVSEK
jgi:esterase/lipase